MSDTTTTIERFEVRKRFSGEVAFTAEIETTPGMSRGWKLRLAVAWALAASVPCDWLDLSGADFSGWECPAGSSFVGSRFDGSRFDGSSFVDSRFDGSRFDGSSFVGSSFVGSSFVGSSFVGSSFDGSSFVGSSFVDSRFDGSSFVDSRFDGSRFDGEARVREDMFRVLSTAHAEIPGVITALREGRVNGSVYTGECACLVGTIANIRGCDVDQLDRNSSSPAERWFMMISPGDVPGDSSPGAYAAAKAVEWTLEYCAANGIELPETEGAGQ